jgi:hypothetical protein
VNPSAIAGLRLDAVGGRALPAVHTALVYALDGVRFVAAATSRRALILRVAEYVGRETNNRLWPADARQVETLLAGGAHEEAVELYFALVGKRWDDEWLLVTDPLAA